MTTAPMEPMEVMGKGGSPEARSMLMGEVGFTQFTHRLIRVGTAMRLGSKTFSFVLVCILPRPTTECFHSEVRGGETPVQASNDVTACNITV